MAQRFRNVIDVVELHVDRIRKRRQRLRFGAATGKLDPYTAL